MKFRLLRNRSGMARVLLYGVLIVVCWELYHFISLVTPRHTAIAHQHAAALIALEQRLGILFEPQIQRFALHHAHPHVLGWLLDNAAIRDEAKQVYTGGQIPWLSSMLIWAALFRPRYVKRLCILAIGGSLIGIMIAALYPVAPPRFAMAGSPYNVEDVNILSSPEQMLVRYGGFDPYAAMPSLHVLWGLVTGFGLFLTTRRKALRVLATIFPLTIVADVIVTGNHYVLDCVASMLVFTGCLAGYRIHLRLFRIRRLSTSPGSVSDPPTLYGGHERRVAPNLRPIDIPVLLCIIAGVVMLLSVDNVQRILGLLLIVCGALAAPVAVRRIKVGIALRDTAPTAEWFSGFLLVAGATTLGAGDVLARSAGGLCWAAAALLPLLAHLRADVWVVETGSLRMSHSLSGRAAAARELSWIAAHPVYSRVKAYVRGSRARVLQTKRAEAKRRSAGKV